MEPLEQRQLLSAAMVRDLTPGEGSTNPGALTVVGKTLYFSGGDSSSDDGAGLYRSDGTSAGTTEVMAFPGRRRSRWVAFAVSCISLTKGMMEATACG